MLKKTKEFLVLLLKKPKKLTRILRYFAAVFDSKYVKNFLDCLRRFASKFKDVPVTEIMYTLMTFFLFLASLLLVIFFSMFFFI